MKQKAKTNFCVLIATLCHFFQAVLFASLYMYVSLSLTHTQIHTNT
jgi:hypothetical protein